jgi:RNA polymerase sigma-70 factor (ECF subfamily)
VANNALSGLVARVAGRDTQAFGELYDLTSRLVYSLARRMLRRAEDAEEAVADVYAQVWRDAVRYDPGRGSVEAWLVTLTQSRGLDRLRSLAARPDLEALTFANLRLVDEHRRPDRLLVHADARRRAMALLHALTKTERRMIELAFFEGYTHSELAAVLDLPLGTVKTRIRSALLKMRRVSAAQNAAVHPIVPPASVTPAAAELCCSL